jgi:hypothetical protein
MLIGEAILSAIVDAVIAYTFEKSADQLGERVRERLGLDPTKKALKEALGQAFEHLSQRHPQWVADNFDASFFEHEGAPVLAQFLVECPECLAVREIHPKGEKVTFSWHVKRLTAAPNHGPRWGRRGSIWELSRKKM